MLLMIDNYDSFTYNLVQYFRELGEDVVVYRNNEVTLEEIEELLPERIVISPGPCTPREAGVSVDVIKRFAGRIPILGVCLGHQAICYAFGGEIVQAKELMHGKTSQIFHDGKTIMHDINNPFEATRYHSLAVEMKGLEDAFEVSAWTKDGEVMGIRHKTHMLEGVQFHPESILTKEGMKILENFVSISKRKAGSEIMIKQAIDKAVNMVHLKEHEMAQVMEDIMEGKTTPAQIASLITALRIKGETVDEVVGAVKVMRSKAAKMAIDGESINDCINRRNSVIIDIVGTGGDGTMTFNISTAAAFVAAAGGATVAKHGNRSVSSRCGSADVLEKLGVDIEASPDAVAKHISEIGIAFMFAPVFHGSTRHALGPRKEIGIRTIFNMLGPLTNPASARHLLLGVYNERLCGMFADVLLKLGAERAMIVYGHDGMDEISVTTDTKVAEIKDGEICHYLINPKDFGLKEYDIEDLRGGDAHENAQILKGIFSGKENGAKRAAVLINAGAAFYVAGIRRDIKEGIAYAEEVIDSGKALSKLEELAGAGRG